ncbi:hypothetical protein TIFTF001_005714 [Ficus carica]|uniref:Uncharacterized protein n=1 Tax=Ficus carica TaxID=3494 RepID=A0AA87ZLC5_FICCA|nr:hypothetical protein TIFTF001_005714 [Ficus carica]
MTKDRPYTEYEITERATSASFGGVKNKHGDSESKSHGRNGDPHDDRQNPHEEPARERQAPIIDSPALCWEAGADPADESSCQRPPGGLVPAWKAIVGMSEATPMSASLFFVDHVVQQKEHAGNSTTRVIYGSQSSSSPRCSEMSKSFSFLRLCAKISSAVNPFVFVPYTSILVLLRQMWQTPRFHFLKESLRKKKTQMRAVIAWQVGGSHVYSNFQTWSLRRQSEVEKKWSCLALLFVICIRTFSFDSYDEFINM